MTTNQEFILYPSRRRLLITVSAVLATVLLYRAVDLQILSKEFLRNHGDARSVRVVSTPAHRGMIVDRNHEPLAISTPVESVWAVPQEVLSAEEKIPALAAALKMDVSALKQLLQDRVNREFVYLKRHITPDQARIIRSVAAPGINLQNEYKRYYPAAEVTAHVVGFTNIDDHGQEGLELAYDDWLRGDSGSKRVLKDRLGRTVQDIESIKTSKPGKQLVLSIDRRIQYLAHRELEAAVSMHRASGGSLVMLDCETGEVLAMVGQPSYNPNHRSDLKSEHYRNRAVTDVFEPGSTMKPFTVTAALMSGMYTPDSIIETAPGYIKISDHTIEDINNYGTMNVVNVIRKSSNVGASKIALSLGPKKLWDVYLNVGFGRETGSGFPGESPGLVNNYNLWSEVELATIAFGYGIAVTTLQLAHAYTIIAADGWLRPVSFLKIEEPLATRQVLPAPVTAQIRGMLETVVQKSGTGYSAAVKGYRVAGKTGTVHKTSVGGYAEDRYMSLFSGMAPVSSPRLVLVVMINEPRGDQHYGGQVAAPVFAKVMQGALSILNIPPDDLHSMDSQIIMAQSDAWEQQVLKE